MLNIIKSNPYRILGVYSNSTKKEQIANKGKMQAFLRVNKSMPFPLDLKSIMSSVERTQESIDKADSSLVLQEEQVKYAQFWFIKQTPIDDIAFNHLIAGNMDDAIAIWNKSLSMTSLQNLFICHLIKGDYNVAIKQYAVPLYERYAFEFISTISENCEMTHSDLVHNVIDVLQSEGINLGELSSLDNEIWTNYIDSKRINPLTSQLDSALAKAKESREKGTNERLNAGKKLIIDTKDLLYQLKEITGTEDSRYQMIADKIAQETLQCSIDYYNDTDDLDKPVKALPLCEYACSIAVGTAAVQRCKENKNTISEAVKNMPPASVIYESREINKLFNWYSEASKTSASGLQLLKRAQKPLTSIKEKLGKTNNYYLDISSTLGIAALGFVIEEVNNVQKEEKPVNNPFDSLFGLGYSGMGFDFLGQERKKQRAQALKSALKSAWQTILYIDLLDTTREFKEKRYKPNRKTLYDIINGLKGFDYPDENYIIKGCCHGLSADQRFFWCDSEYFSACYDKASYEDYVRRFSNGKHVSEANKRIEEIRIRNEKIMRYVIIAAVIIAILCCITFAANAKSCYPKSFDRSIQTSQVYEEHDNNKIVIMGKQFFSNSMNYFVSNNLYSKYHS